MTTVAVCRLFVALVSGLITVVTFDCVTEIIQVDLVTVVQVVAVVPPHIVVLVRQHAVAISTISPFISVLHTAVAR